MPSLKTLLLIATFAAVFSSTLAQTTKEYVCTPCGSACDKVVHAKPGLCPACNMKLVERSSIQFENLAPAEFCKRITPQAILLDVRTPSEFDGSAWRTSYGHFKNAININVEELEARIGELGKFKDREILVYCSHSMRSPRAATMLTAHGFKKVINMSGGVSTLSVEGNACLKENFVAH